jgi:hypothetical protein
MALNLPTREELTATVRAHVAGLPNMRARALCANKTELKNTVQVNMIRRQGIYVPDYRNPALPAGINVLTGLEKIITEAMHIREKNAVDNEYVNMLEAHWLTLDPAKAKFAADQVFVVALKLAEDMAKRQELTRMMLVTTGAITIATAQAVHGVDYQIAADHKKSLAGTKKWNAAAAFDGDILVDFDNAKNAINGHSSATATTAVMNSVTYAALYAAVVKQYGGEDKLPSGWRDQHANSHLQQIRGITIDIDDRSNLAWTTKKAGALTILADGIVVFHGGKGTMTEHETLVRDLEAGTDTGFWCKLNVIPDPSAVEVIVQANHLFSMDEPDKVYVLTAF